MSKSGNLKQNGQLMQGESTVLVS